MIIDQQHAQGQLKQSKQALKTIELIFEQCNINEKTTKDQAQMKSQQSNRERSGNKLYKLLRTWTLEENILFLSFLVENKEAFQEEVVKQKRKIFFFMAKKVKLRVSSVCCKRFYQLYSICDSNINGIIRKMSEFIEKQRKMKEKQQIKDFPLKTLLEIHNAETDSQCNKMICDYKESLHSESICEEIDYR